MGKLISLGIIIGLGLAAWVVSTVLSRDAVGVLVGVLIGILAFVPPALLIVSTAGSSDRAPVQRPALPGVTVVEPPKRSPPQITDGTWRRLED